MPGGYYAKNGNVYFIQDGTGYIKIGVAENVRKRLTGLQISNANELKVFMILHVKSMRDAVEIERFFHKKFKQYNIRGEWFLENPIIDYLRNGDEPGYIVTPAYKFAVANW